MWEGQLQVQHGTNTRVSSWMLLGEASWPCHHWPQTFQTLWCWSTMPVGHFTTPYQCICYYFMLDFYNDAVQWFPTSSVSGVPPQPCQMNPSSPLPTHHVLNVSKLVLSWMEFKTINYAQVKIIVLFFVFIQLFCPCSAVRLAWSSLLLHYHWRGRSSICRAIYLTFNKLIHLLNY